MAYSIEQIEWLHDNGYMPDWAYYQQNGKSAQQNYSIQKQKLREQSLERRKLEYQQNQVEKEVEEQVSISIERIIDNLFKDLDYNMILK